MRILILTIILLTSNSLFAQTNNLEKPIAISEEEAINIAKREGYYLRSRKLDSNQWIVLYSKHVGFTSGGAAVHKNVSTTIDARTGKIKKKRRYNSSDLGGHGNDRSPKMRFERTKKMKVWGERITVYY